MCCFDAELCEESWRETTAVSGLKRRFYSATSTGLKYGIYGPLLFDGTICILAQPMVQWCIRHWLRIAYNTRRL